MREEEFPVENQFQEPNFSTFGLIVVKKRRGEDLGKKVEIPGRNGPRVYFERRPNRHGDLRLSGRPLRRTGGCEKFLRHARGRC